MIFLILINEEEEVGVYFLYLNWLVRDLFVVNNILDISFIENFSIEERF